MNIIAERTGTAGSRGPGHRGAVTTTGLCGAVLLALAACGQGDDPREEDSGQQGIDPSGATDQGQAPQDIAGNDDGQEAGEAPALDEVSDEIWSNMEDAGTVTVDATVPFEADDVDSHVDEADVQNVEHHYSGQIDGSALTFIERAADAEAEYITFDQETYLRGEHEIDRAQQQDTGDFDEQALTDQLEGSWVEYTEFVPEGFSIQEWFVTFRAELEQANGFDALEATAEQRDGEEVWVYSDQSSEFVVRAGDEPLFLSISTQDDDGQDLEATFSDWGQAEEPERPDEEDIVTAEDLEGLLDQAG